MSTQLKQLLAALDILDHNAEIVAITVNKGSTCRAMDVFNKLSRHTQNILDDIQLLIDNVLINDATNTLNHQGVEVFRSEVRNRELGYNVQIVPRDNAAAITLRNTIVDFNYSE